MLPWKTLANSDIPLVFIIDLFAKKTCQIEACISPKLQFDKCFAKDSKNLSNHSIWCSKTHGNASLPSVLNHYCEFLWNTCFNLTSFFAKKSIMNTKGMSLLPRGSQGNIT